MFIRGTSTSTGGEGGGDDYAERGGNMAMLWGSGSKKYRALTKLAKGFFFKSVFLSGQGEREGFSGGGADGVGFREGEGG